MAGGNKPGVYIDSCYFIDIAKHKIGATLESERTNNVWYCKQLMKAHRDGHLRAFTSTLTIAECQHAGDSPPPPEVQGLFRKLRMSGTYVILVEASAFIAEDARDLRWKHGISLSGADAVHVASAVNRKCREFITTDAEIMKPKMQAAAPLLSALKLCLIVARDTSVLPAGYRQHDLPISAPTLAEEL